MVASTIKNATTVYEREIGVCGHVGVPRQKKSCGDPGVVNRYTDTTFDRYRLPVLIDRNL